MAQRKTPVRSRATSLVTTLLDNPQLPTYIQRLEGGSLARLVQHVGKEDAQSLLVYASPQQIRELIEIDTWESPRPGSEETFSPEKFLEWIELWSDLGAAYLTAQLKNLGSQLFALTLDRYVVVIDIYEVGVSGWVDTFNRFGVMPKDDEYWDLIFQFLTEVWDEDAGFLEEALAYCCQRRSLTVEKTHITGNEALSPDVEEERDRHRRERGYVTAPSASAFLSRLKSSSLQELIIDSRYDPTTGMQLRQRFPEQDLYDTEEYELRDTSLFTDSDPSPDESARRQQRELEILLEPIFTETTRARALLLDGPAPSEKTCLDRHLARLALMDGAICEQRFREIVYLANVLMEGSALAGRRLSEHEATTCVHRTSNLGLVYCLEEAPWDEETRLLEELLEEEPGLIRCFSIGYHLLQQLAASVRQTLLAALQTDESRRRLQEEPWLQTLIREACAALPASSATNAYNLGPLLDSLVFLCDATTLEQLRLLNEDLPRFPRSCDEDAPASIHVNKDWRFFTLPADLHRIQDLLENLPARLW